MAAPKIFDAIIIGGGPAGLSAALALARVCRTSVLFDSGEYRNQGVEAMHTFLSRDGIHPEEFREAARQQIQEKYSTQVSFMKGRVVRVNNREILPGYTGFEAVEARGQAFLGRKLILATGTEDIFPDIEGFKENWPDNIHNCPFCDGYETQAHPDGTGILTFANPSYLSYALMILRFNKANTTIYTDGPAPSDEPTQSALRIALANGIRLDTRRIRRLVSNHLEKGMKIEFETGSPQKVGMLFHRTAMRARGREALIEQLGLEVKLSGDVAADSLTLQANGVRGVFVAGDVCEMAKQAVIAAAHGVRAAGGVVHQLVEEEGAAVEV
ncbi:FAD/NAD(P)-binding domain-containing protein [Parathielavia appendiculata]|uniref:FAD/NAD(P)-binding domain-containing protein n=1 Tax=Parathielavia appendiculata TaxID=2587402 RepID=A0AAN6U5D1_9PEZI|nr:FAD/NAD(P)-binding domain-containing protein [Parathielavia appendiculata]